jgi:hypothetical protein
MPLQALQAHATREPFGYRSCVTKASFAAIKTYDDFFSRRSDGRAKPFFWQA